MQKQLLDLFPQWVHQKQNANLIMTNDLDSIVSCSILKQVFGYEVNQYYSFSKLSQKDLTDNRECIGVDLAIRKGKTYDNHLTMFNDSSNVNSESANINSVLGISSERYHEKFAMSTAIMLWSLYDLPLPNTLEGKLILLSIDSGFKGHYDERFNTVHNKYLELMGFTELIDILNTYDKSVFEKIVRQMKEQDDRVYRRKSGEIYTNLNLENTSKWLGVHLETPIGQFKTIQEFENEKFERKYTNDLINYESIFSFALTHKNYGMMSTYRQEKQT
jgi:hypothetical protein